MASLHPDAQQLVHVLKSELGQMITDRFEERDEKITLVDRKVDPLMAATEEVVGIVEGRVVALEQSSVSKVDLRVAVEDAVTNQLELGD